MRALRFIFQWPRPRALYLLEVLTFPASLVLRGLRAGVRTLRRGCRPLST